MCVYIYIYIYCLINYVVMRRAAARQDAGQRRRARFKARPKSAGRSPSNRKISEPNRSEPIDLRKFGTETNRTELVPSWKMLAAVAGWMCSQLAT